MTTPAKPLTADAVAMLKRAYAKHDDIQHLIATIAQQQEQIEKLRKALTAISMMPPLVVRDIDGTKTKYDEEIQIAREALAVTEPKP